MDVRPISADVSAFTCHQSLCTPNSLRFCADSQRGLGDRLMFTTEGPTSFKLYDAGQTLRITMRALQDTPPTILDRSSRAV